MEKDAAISLRINAENSCHNEFKVQLSIFSSELSNLSQKHKSSKINTSHTISLDQLPRPLRIKYANYDIWFFNADVFANPIKNQLQKIGKSFTAIQIELTSSMDQNVKESELLICNENWLNMWIGLCSQAIFTFLTVSTPVSTSCSKIHTLITRRNP